MSVCIRGHRKALRRAAALDLYRQKILLPLHHRSHHRRTGEKSAERCRNHRAGVMIHSRLLHQMARCDRKCADTSLRCGSSYNIISILTHFVLLFYCCCISDLLHLLFLLRFHARYLFFLLRFHILYLFLLSSDSLFLYLLKAFYLRGRATT